LSPRLASFRAARIAAAISTTRFRPSSIPAFYIFASYSPIAFDRILCGLATISLLWPN
jgi:hypothetical protein